MENKFELTKDKIKQYLWLYKDLDSAIKERELRHIKYAPNFSEFKQNINTIENQVIALDNDKKLQEMRFYRAVLDRNFCLIKITKDKLYSNFIQYRYIDKLSKREIKRKLNIKDITYVENEIIEYLYQNIRNEVLNCGKLSSK